MDNDFEREVIDRLARIETEQKQIRQDISDFQALEKRVTELENAEQQRQGKVSLVHALWALVGAGVGSIVSILIGRMFI